MLSYLFQVNWPNFVVYKQVHHWVIGLNDNNDIAINYSISNFLEYKNSESSDPSLG